MHKLINSLLFSVVFTIVFAAQAIAEESRWYDLFDGKTLEGWRVAEHPDSIRVEKGVIICDGARAHAFYDGGVGKHDFKNFELEAESMLVPGASSGIYFHTEYQEKGFPGKGHELQINNTHRTPKRTGSLYEIVNLDTTKVKDNEWIKLRIVVEAKRIQLFVNGDRAVDYTEPADYQPDAERPGRKIASGTVALQCTDPASTAYFRNIRIRMLP